MLPLQRIHLGLSEETVTGRRIARHLLADYPFAGLVSLSTVGAAVHAHPATVLRYVQRLGYPSYKDFQAALREEARTAPEVATDTLRPADALVASVAATLQGMERGDLDAVVELLLDRKRRVLCGGGTFSHVLAEFLWQHLRVLRPGTVLLPRGLPSPGEASALRRSDILVLFDYSPHTKRTLAFARAAAARATLIAVTDPHVSPVVDHAEHVLVTHVGGIGSFDSFAPAIAALELVVTTMEGRVGDSVRKRVLRIDQLGKPS